MPVTIIDEKEAPAPPKFSSALTLMSLEVLNGLKKGKVARITPDEDETPRGVKQSLARIAKANNTKISLWEVDSVVYAKLAGG